MPGKTYLANCSVINFNLFYPYVSLLGLGKGLYCTTKTGFGHFLEFGLFLMADIAYSDRQKRYISTLSDQDAGKGH